MLRVNVLQISYEQISFRKLQWRCSTKHCDLWDGVSPTRRLVWQTNISCHTPLTSLWSPSSLTTPALTSLYEGGSPGPAPSALNIDGAVREGWSLSPPVVWPLPIASLFSGCSWSPFNFFPSFLRFISSLLLRLFQCGRMKLSAASTAQYKETHQISRNESDKCLLLAVASCTAVRRDFLEMTLCVYLIPVFASLSMCGAFMLCIMTLTTELQLYERKW